MHVQDGTIVKYGGVFIKGDLISWKIKIGTPVSYTHLDVYKRQEVTTCYFPDKRYGDIIFPEGNYEALRIVLGKDVYKRQAPATALLTM